MLLPNAHSVGETTNKKLVTAFNINRYVYNESVN